MRDVMCFKIGGKLMNKDEARKIGGTSAECHITFPRIW